MAMTLASLKPTTADQPPRILIYGDPGIGKTTLASEFPDAAFVRIEDGIPANVNALAFPVAESFQDVMEALGVLYTEETGVRTLVVDSVTELQKLVFAETCARGDEHGHAKANIDAFGFGKGYVFAKQVMQEFLDAINTLRREKGMTIILIAHAAVTRFDDPETQSYDRWSIDLHKQLVGMVEREMDAILLLKTPIDTATVEEASSKDGPAKRVIAKGKRVRVLYTEGTPAMIAKNRYDIPSGLRVDVGAGYAALAPYLPGHREAVAASEKEAA